MYEFRTLWIRWSTYGNCHKTDNNKSKFLSYNLNLFSWSVKVFECGFKISTKFESKNPKTNIIYISGKFHLRIRYVRSIVEERSPIRISWFDCLFFQIQRIGPLSFQYQTVMVIITDLLPMLIHFLDCSCSYIRRLHLHSNKWTWIVNNDHFPFSPNGPDRIYNTAHKYILSDLLPRSDRFE